MLKPYLTHFKGTGICQLPILYFMEFMEFIIAGCWSLHFLEKLAV